MMVSLCTLGKPVIIQVGCEDHQDICNDLPEGMDA